MKKTAHVPLDADELVSLRSALSFMIASANKAGIDVDQPQLTKLQERLGLYLDFL